MRGKRLIVFVHIFLKLGLNVIIRRSTLAYLIQGGLFELIILSAEFSMRRMSTLFEGKPEAFDVFTICDNHKSRSTSIDAGKRGDRRTWADIWEAGGEGRLSTLQVYLLNVEGADEWFK